MESAIQVRKRGVMTIPSELREKYSIQEGDTFQLVDMNGIFVLTPMVPMVPELAKEIERFRKESEVSTEELMQGLREERERYYQGKYGDD
jgi:AbrB family looped-hinge helix DNA binding protein